MHRGIRHQTLAPLTSSATSKSIFRSGFDRSYVGVPACAQGKQLAGCVHVLEEHRYAFRQRQRHFHLTHAAEKPNDEKGEDSAVPAPTSNLPGLAGAAAVAAAGFYGADLLGHALLSAQGIENVTSSPISGIPVSIILGLGINDLIGTPISFEKGLKVSSTTVLRAGIICVGAKLRYVVLLFPSAYCFTSFHIPFLMVCLFCVYVHCAVSLI